MKLLIDIPEEKYDWIMNHLTLDRNFRECKITPLQKGHEDLICRDTIANYVNSHILEINTGYGDLNQHTNRILRMIEDYIYKMPTITEIDNGESEK